MKNFILNKSGSYKFYKENYEKNNAADEYSKQLNDLKKEVDNLKKDLNTQKGYINAYHILFNSIFLDHDLKPIKLLKDCQTLSYELQKFVDNICRENDLLWWLDFGTLLGAVRHDGFIPWDDDTDVGMMREDSIKFKELFLNEIKKQEMEDFFKINYIPRGSKGRKGETFMQIFVVQKIHTGYLEAFAGVDIFPYDYISKWDEKTIDEVYLKAQSNYFENLYEQKEDALETLYDELNLSFEKTDYIINGVEAFRGPNGPLLYDVYKYEDIFPLQDMKFGPEMFPCPNNPHAYLEGIYKDHMLIPKRTTHHRRIDRLRYNPNNDELYEKCINKFREVNEKYE